MLEESNKLLAQVKFNTKLKEIKRAKRVYVFNFIKKWSLRIGLTVLIAAVLFLPVETGTIIGNWVHDFFGTIYKNTIK